MSRENLVKLAKFILENIKDEQFNMSSFRLNKYYNSVRFKSKEDCGTIGCALGWAPFVEGLEVVKSDYYKGEPMYLDFDLYSKRVFGTAFGIFWEFLFSLGWHEIDNTREGFVRRFVYLIEVGDNLSITKNHPYRKINENNNYDLESVYKDSLSREITRNIYYSKSEFLKGIFDYKKTLKENKAIFSRFLKFHKVSKEDFTFIDDYERYLIGRKGVLSYDLDRVGSISIVKIIDFFSTVVGVELGQNDSYEIANKYYSSGLGTYYRSRYPNHYCFAGESRIISEISEDVTLKIQVNGKIIFKGLSEVQQKTLLKKISLLEKVSEIRYTRFPEKKLF